MSKTARSRCSLLVSSSPACASAQSPDVYGQVPDKLKPAATNPLAMIVSRRRAGLRVPCQKDQAGGYEWRSWSRRRSFRRAWDRPADTMPATIGEATDASKILGTVKKVPTRQWPTHPWLLLAAKSVGSEGLFGR